MEGDPVAQSVRLMESFAERTGLREGGDARRRYLWTDAYALRACLALHRETGSRSWLRDAIAIARFVHAILGRHRPDDARTGWISGLPEADGARRPTAGGLRIGKPLPERRADQPLDERLEWERDGQYFHYLTRWMQALSLLSRETGEERWNAWAAELGRVAVRAFRQGGPDDTDARLYWKMSIDLTRPLVRSVGQHDPLDGLVTLLAVRATQREFGLRRPAQGGPILDEEIELLRQMCARSGPLGTTDPLGLGGLLEAAVALAEIAGEHGVVDPTMLHGLLADAHRGIDVLTQGPLLSLPLAVRLPFRELGLAIGLHGTGRIAGVLQAHPDRFGSAASEAALRGRVEAMEPLLGLARSIDAAWTENDAQKCDAWIAHRDINSVMLAVSLLEGAREQRVVSSRS